MVKLTIVGRATDGLPLAQRSMYVNENNENLSDYYKEKGEFILKEISRGELLPTSKMTIRVDHHCFNYIIEDGVCFMTLCDSSYPTNLAFHYLQDLHKEFHKFDTDLVHQISSPYSFVKFDGIIGNVRRRYLDTRTQANLAKLNADRRKDASVVAEHLLQIVERRRRLEILEKMMEAHLSLSPIWTSKTLEVLAIKWIPITMTIIVAAVFLWTGATLQHDFIVTSF